MEYFSITSHIHKTTKQVSDMQIRFADSDSVESHFIVRHQHDNLITTNHPPCCNSNITELFKTATTVILPHFTFSKKNFKVYGQGAPWDGRESQIHTNIIFNTIVIIIYFLPLLMLLSLLLFFFLILLQNFYFVSYFVYCFLSGSHSSPFRICTFSRMVF